HRLLGADLVAHGAYAFGTRSDEDETALFHPFREIGVFRQEAVAGVDGLGVCDFGGRDQRGHVQIAVAPRGGPDADGFIGQAHVLGLAVGLGMHDHGLDAQFAAGTQDPKGDFAAIGDQDFFEHGVQAMMNRGWPYSTGSPFSTRISLITPDLSASISFSSFIASMMHRGSPSLTAWPTSTTISLLTPDLSASISFSSFVGSVMHRGSPSLTAWPTSTKAGAFGLGAR